MPRRGSVDDQVTTAISQVLRSALATEYPSAQIQEVGAVVSGATPRTSSPEYWGGEYVWVTPRDLGKERSIEVATSERRITQDGLDSIGNRLFPEGTVLFSSRAPIGHVAVAAVELATNQGFKSVVCGGDIDSRYMFHLLRADTALIEEEGRGNTFKEIPARVMKEWTVPVPDLHAQQSVASYLDTVYERVGGRSALAAELPACFAGLEDSISALEQVSAAVRVQERIARDLADLLPALLAAALNQIGR